MGSRDGDAGLWVAAKRYELSDEQWEQIASLLPGKAGDPGQPGGRLHRTRRCPVTGDILIFSGYPFMPSR